MFKFHKSKSINNETKNDNHMGRNFDNVMDRRTTPGSILPLTPYERWQLEKYGNFISEKQIEENETDIEFFNMAGILSIEIDGTGR
jgi:hypothetical protein